MASDQIANQAGKWHYMSGAQVEVPLVIRASVGAGKGYGGQHCQTPRVACSRTSRACVVVYPATAGRRQGPAQVARSARTTRSLFVREPGPLRRPRASCPRSEYARARSAWRASPARARDATIVAWGPAVARRAGGRRDARGRARASRPRSSTCAASSRSTWRRSSRRSARPAAAWSPARPSSSAASSTRSSRASRREAFDDLDAPGRPDRRRQRHLARRPRRSRRPSCRTPRDIVAAVRAPRAERRGPPMVHPILMPKPGQMTEECTVTPWLKQEGDPVHRGDVLFEIETDKCDMEVEAFDEGVLLAHRCARGGRPSRSTPSAPGSARPGEAIPEAAAPRSARPPLAPAPATAAASRRRRRSAGTVAATARRRRGRAAQPERRAARPRRRRQASRISPRASRLAAELGLDPRTRDRHGARRTHRRARRPGRRRRPRTAEVRRRSPHSPAARPRLGGRHGPVPPVAPSPVGRRSRARARPLSRMRQTIARRLTENSVRCRTSRSPSPST